MTYLTFRSAPHSSWTQSRKPKAQNFCSTQPRCVAHLRYSSNAWSCGFQCWQVHCGEYLSYCSCHSRSCAVPLPPLLSAFPAPCLSQQAGFLQTIYGWTRPMSQSPHCRCWLGHHIFGTEALFRRPRTPTFSRRAPSGRRRFVCAPLPS
jgi:hypothetical protein